MNKPSYTIYELFSSRVLDRSLVMTILLYLFFTFPLIILREKHPAILWGLNILSMVINLSMIIGNLSHTRWNGFADLIRMISEGNYKRMVIILNGLLTGFLFIHYLAKHRLQKNPKKSPISSISFLYYYFRLA